MTQDIITLFGQEYDIKNGLDGATVDIGLYNDSTDNVQPSDDLSAITTEPSNTNYGRNGLSLSAFRASSNWGANNNASFDFDFSDQTVSEEVDSAFLVITFQSEESGDGSQNDHLIATSALTQTRDIGSIDFLEFDAGDVELINQSQA
jgi:hypothetical protein